MAKVKECGPFRLDGNELIPIDFDWASRQLWLYKIHCVEYREIGSSNYSYDQIGTYNFIFHINCGDFSYSYRGTEDYYYIIQLEISEWYRDELQLSIGLEKALESYPILDINKVLDAFKQRKYYTDVTKLKLIE
jgi:hypothetical protein